jgi:cytochrome c556
MTMRKPLFVLLAQCALLASVASAPVEPDSDLMRSIDETTRSLDSNVSLKDAKAASAEARELVETFGRIEAHYAEKPETADAVDFAHRAQSLATQAQKAIDAQDFDAAADAVNQLTRSCKSCHEVYKKT